MNDIIKYWDTNLVEQHIVNDIARISGYLNEKNIKTISMIDVGANVGKIYDNLKKQFTIEKCIMIEPVNKLYEYLKNKYKDDTSVEVYNFAISNEPGNFKMYAGHFEENIITEISNTINLGVSKLSDIPGETICITMNEFLDKYCSIDPLKLSLIKIDTETKDLFVIKQLTDYIEKNKIFPFITFEKNYSHQISDEEAQSIIDNFCLRCNYTVFDITTCPTDYFLRPV